MFEGHSETCAIIQGKSGCRPGNPAYSVGAGYTERYVLYVLLEGGKGVLNVIVISYE